MNGIYYPPGETAPPDESKPLARVEQDLWAVVHSFTLLKSKLFLDGAMSPGALATALETFKGLTQEQLALLLAYGLEGAGGGGVLPDPLVVATLQATSQVQVPNGVAGTPALQIGVGQYGFYRTGTSVIVNTGGIFPITFAPAGVTLAVPLNANNIPITNLPDPTVAQHAANMRWCQANFAPIVELAALKARIAVLEARLGP